MIEIRPIRLEDASAVREIYAPSVLETIVSFETSLPAVEEFENRIRTTTARYPWLVYETEGKVVAYAYAGVFKARAAYDWTVETTIYVHKDFLGQGIGDRLYRTLFEKLSALGIVNLIAIISLPNDASVLFHERLGFRHVGRLTKIGFKFGTWWDIGYWQLDLKTASLQKSE